MDISEKVLSEQITSILDYYLRNNRILDNKAINDITYTYLDFYGLRHMVSYVGFDSNCENFAGAFNLSKKIIIFDIVKLFEYSDSFLARHPHLVCYNNVNSINFQICIALFHELRHVKQFHDLGYDNINTNRSDSGDFQNVLKSLRKLKDIKKIGDFDINKLDIGGSIISDLVNYIEKLRINNFDFYSDYHNCFPIEKDANMFAYEFSILCFSNLSLDIVSDDEIRAWNNDMLTMMISGYNPDRFIGNPLKNIFFSSVNYSGEDLGPYIKYFMMKLAINLEKYSLADRLRLNFPITKDEYQHIIDIINYFNNNRLLRHTNVKQLVLSR